MPRLLSIGRPLPPLLERLAFFSYGVAFSDGKPDFTPDQVEGRLFLKMLYPRPTNGIWFAITVMNSTLVSSGSPAM
jgi:hypothetical protein